MKIYKKVKDDNKRKIYFLGKKIFSYKVKSKKETNNTLKTSYGNIYMPYYNIDFMPKNNEAEIYNKDGQAMRTFFLRDFHMAADPTCQSKYFIWDKFNIGLDVYFYSHNAMLEQMGNPKHKFGFFIETEAIVPDDYKIFERNPELAKQFHLIFTSSKKILDTVPNARFAPMNCSLFGGSFTTTDGYKYKNKKVSIISSNKLMCELHKYRYDLAWQCKNKSLADTFGTFDGGQFVNVDETLREYYYSICIENTQTPYLFTERLVCAFANQCIPIYLGATEIDKFFNPDGIIKISKESDIEKVIASCTKEEYMKRLPAILDNYERVKQYINPWDYIYEKYVKKIVSDKTKL